LSALRAGRTLPPGFFFLRFLVLISVRGWTMQIQLQLQQIQLQLQLIRIMHTVWQ
jgi:hypothetical protein